MSAQALLGIDSPTAAAWVQAVGSVLAIFVAIWVAWWQARRAAQQGREERSATGVERAKIIVALLNEAADYAAYATADMAASVGTRGLYLKLRYRPDDIEDLIRAIAAVPVSDLSRVEFVWPLIQTRRDLRDLRELLSKALEALDQHKDPTDAWRSLFFIAEAIERYRDAAQAGLDRPGATTPRDWTPAFDLKGVPVRARINELGIRPPDADWGEQPAEEKAPEQPR